MKVIGNLTEEQATAIAAAAVQYRAVRGARIVRAKPADQKGDYLYRQFAVEIDTFSAEEVVGGPQRA